MKQKCCKNIYSGILKHMNYQNIAYKRVSSFDQSTDRQLDGMTFDKVFEEKISAKNSKRPQLQAMLQYIREGDHVYVHSLDRLARNLKDLLDIVNDITAKGCTVHFVTNSMEFSQDSANPMAKLMLQVLGEIHEFEQQVIRARQKEGIEAAKKRGQYKPGRPKKLCGEKLENCRKMMSQGIPISKIASELGVSRSTIFRTMK